MEKNNNKIKKNVQFSSNTEYEVSNSFDTSQHASKTDLSNPVYKSPHERTLDCVAPSSSMVRPNYEGNIVDK
jgi:hypothetical protein